MNDVSIVGIDPGIVHTGCVALWIDERNQTLEVFAEVINGVDVSKVNDWVEHHNPAALFVEDYNPGNYQREDKKMSEALGRLKHVFPPSSEVWYVDNAGVNTLVPKTVLATFGVDVFPVKTHHNDLVSAGKILLLGMLQDKESRGYRELISKIVWAKLSGRPWRVIVHA